HANGVPAAVAALVARERGKFWPMHDMLFANQLTLSTPTIKGLAADLGVPGADVQKAIDTGAYAEELARYEPMAKEAGATKRPAVFLNGRPYELGNTVDQMALAADEESEW